MTNQPTIAQLTSPRCGESVVRTTDRHREWRGLEQHETTLRQLCSVHALRIENRAHGLIVELLRVTGRVATATIALNYPAMLAFDHLPLLKQNGEWRIVGKPYDANTPVP